MRGGVYDVGDGGDLETGLRWFRHIKGRTVAGAQGLSERGPRSVTSPWNDEERWQSTTTRGKRLSRAEPRSTL
jgi:hypothetical protein